MVEYFTNFTLRKDTLLLRGIKNGKPFSRRVKPKSQVYVLANDNKQATGEFSLQGEPLARIDFETVTEGKDFAAMYADVSEFRIFYNHRPAYGIINSMYPNKIAYKLSDVSVAYIDIECECESGFPKPQFAAEMINAITLFIDGCYHVFGLHDFDKSEIKLKGNETLEYWQAETEYELLDMFLAVWKTKYPHIVTGWNIEGFDIPYLVNRIAKVLGDNRMQELSPWDNVFIGKGYDQFGNEQQRMDILGVAILDYLKIYQKFTAAEGKKESYRLGFIAEHEDVLEQKMSIAEYGSIAALYRTNYQKFIEYNIQDVKAVRSIEAKRKLMESAIALAYNAKINFSDVLSQVRMWECIIMNDMYARRQIPEQKKKYNNRTGQIMGAYVKPPKVGMKEWVITIDLDALYPSLMRMLNISPETLLPDSISEMIDMDAFIRNRKPVWTDANEIFALNQARFIRDKVGMFPDLIERMYADRKKYKKLLIETKKELETLPDDVRPEVKRALEDKISEYNVTQAYLKICLNSLYGVLAQPSFMFYDVRAAEAVTITGQGAIKWIAARLNEYFNDLLDTKDYDYIQYIDTDSVTIDFGPMVKKYMKTNDEQAITDFLSKVFNSRVLPYIEKMYDEFTSHINAPTNYLVFKLDTITNKAIYLTKKQYIYNVMEAEGVRYTKPKRKIMGGAPVKSSTPKICRDKMKETIDLVFEGDQAKVRAFIEKFRADYRKLPLDEIATPCGMSELNKFRDASMIYRKGTPVHVKGSLIFNKALVDCGIDKIYRPIENGDKVKWTYLKVPNPFKQEVISFRDYLPEEIESRYKVSKYVDYPEQFQKTFLNYIDEVMAAANMTLRDTSTLDAFF